MTPALVLAHGPAPVLRDAAMRGPLTIHRLGRMRRRAEFLAAAGSRRKWVAPGFVMQVRQRDQRDEARGVAVVSVRLGLTATKKLGNAVVRNRARRRLREAARLVLAEATPPGHDVVLIARAETLTRPFAALQADLQTAVRRLAAGRAKDRAKDRAEEP